MDNLVIVTGLPRSGTSMMMMKMLEAGGIAVITDKQRQADEDNPFTGNAAQVFRLAYRRQTD